ncbi:MAG TPA: Arc family DNA-binding protein [Kiritimatiellia bacterium]|nr:Arc family DNA-binding protein [Kiritimatiellia bacterium]
MSAIIVRDLPEGLHDLLKKDARHHHRSMSKHIVAILEDALSERRKSTLPKPLKTVRPITPEFIDWAKREGRA